MRRTLKKGKLAWKVGKKGTGKIKNATSVEYDGIKFRSKLEAFAYQQFKEAKLPLEYEKETYTIVEGFERFGEKVRPIKVVPDFVDNTNKIIVEIKGFSNEQYIIKLKLFKRYLHINNLDFKLYICRNKGDVVRCVEDIKFNKPYDNKWGIYHK